MRAASAGAQVTRPRPQPRRRPAETPARRPARAPERTTKTRTQETTTRRRSKARARARARSRAGIVWIVVGGLLLAGVVFVNLAVLKLNLRLDSATQERTKLRAENATLQSQLSSALASPRIQSLAHTQDGLTQADPSSIGYIDLGKR